MKLKFEINENHLICHSLKPDNFSDKKFEKEIEDFKEFAWALSQNQYRLLTGKMFDNDFLEIGKLLKNSEKYLEQLRISNEFKILYEQTKEYLNFVKNQWESNYEKTSKIMTELTGLKFDKIFTAYITHPGLRNGCNLGDNLIAWGHKEEFPNYTTVYLWHEVLHSYFKRDDINHAIIQLLTDNELRVRLNGGIYPPFQGHKEFLPIMKKLLPSWNLFLKENQKEINRFIREASKQRS